MPHSVLVVDDDDDTCECLRDILEDQGYNVDTAHCGGDAIALSEKRHYALLLLDFRMPDMNGLETFQRLKDAGADGPALLLTGFLSHDLEQRAQDLGICAVLQKPVDVTALLSRVSTLLAT